MSVELKEVVCAVAIVRNINIENYLWNLPSERFRKKSCSKTVP